MVTSAPTPYRNFGSDIANEDDNADYLQSGVDDAKARLKSASEQYQAMPGIPQETIRNKAAQDVIDRTNAVERARTRARELEIQKKQAPTSGATDLSSLLKYAGNALVPSAGAATLSETTGAPEFHPPMAAPQEPTQQAAGVVQNLRNAGVGQVGDKAIVEAKDNAKTTTTNPLLLDQNDINTVGTAIRGTPEWQRQTGGLDDLEHIIGLEAQRNAHKNSVDLSPLGAYLDYQNRLRGKPTDIAPSLKTPPLEDTSLKDMSEIQRRRADMAKELINTIKASKLGQVVTQDGQVVGYTGGVNIPKPTNMTAGARLNMSAVQNLKKATDASFKDNDEQLKAINTISQRVANSAKNPAESGSIPALLEVMDTGSKRILAGVLGMEGYDPSVPGQIKAFIAKTTQGMIPEQQRGYLLNRLQQAAVRAKQEREARAADLHEYAKSLPVQPEDVTNIVDSHYRMPEKGFPTATAAGAGKNAPTQDEAAHMKMFLDMVKAHEAGK